MSHSVFLVFFLNSSTQQNWAGGAKASLFISRRSAFPTTQLSAPSMLRAYWSKQNESQDGHIRGVMWLVEMILHRERTVVQDDNIIFFSFFFLVWTWCIVVPLFRPPPPSPAVQTQSSLPTGGESGVWGAEWRTCFCLYIEKERRRQSEKKSIHPCSFHPPLHVQTRGCCNADWWARGERRDGFNWSGISGDQSMYWSVIRSSEWVQPLLSPRATPVPPPPTQFQPISEQQDL